jgi:hypothetical protein
MKYAGLGLQDSRRANYSQGLAITGVFCITGIASSTGVGGAFVMRVVVFRPAGI